MTTNDITGLLRPDDGHYTEDVNDGAYWLLQLIAAVDFLRRGDRHAFTVWDALEEALTWWTAEHRDPATDPTNPDNEPSLHAALTNFAYLASRLDIDATESTQQAVRRWVDTISQLYNGGHRWPHPVSR